MQIKMQILTEKNKLSRINIIFIERFLLAVIICQQSLDLMMEILTVICPFMYQATSKEYQRIQEEEEERQQEFLDGNMARLTEIYDKNFWEMKPAAKVTGKDRPAIRECMRQMKAPVVIL